MSEKGLGWAKAFTPNPPPLFCAKGRPCDFDKAASYCLHRECREKLLSHYLELLSKLDTPPSREAPAA